MVVSACVISGCGSTCVDDGLVSQQNNCPTAGGNSATETDSATGSTDSATDSDSTPTDSNSQSQSDPTMGSMSMTNSMSDTVSATDTDSATVSVTDTDSATVSVTDTDSATVSATDTDSATATDSDTDTGGGGLFCVDADMDMFGDPGQCTMVDPGEEPPPGTVPNDDDCDDSSPNTFPGAAENDSPDACEQDEDQDGFGDNMPDNPGVEPGTDCDDADVNTFPGSAENEAAMGCNKDEDGDGWGDASVPPGVDGGKDCHDNNPNYSPDKRVLFTMVDNLPGIVSQIDIESGMVSPLATLVPPLGAWNPYSAAVSPIDGKIFAHNSANTKTRLITLDYCDDGSMPEELADHGQSICGLAFNNDGVLFGIDSGENALVTFDTTTGEITDSKTLTLNGNELDVVSCGMAYDCVGDRLLMTQGQQSRIFEVSPADGAVTEVANPMGGDWTSVGAEYDVISEQMYVANGTPFFQVALDGTDDVTMLPNLSISTNDLTFGPVCP